MTPTTSTPTPQLRPPVNRLSRRAIALWLVQGLTGSVIMIGIAAAVVSWLDNAAFSWIPGWLAERIWWIPALMALIFIPVVVIESLWRYAVHRWEFSSDVVYALSGWISRHWVFVPVSRIQTVDKTQGFFERMLGLATVEIRTASYAGSSTIEGLGYAVAARLADDLARRADEIRDDAT